MEQLHVGGRPWGAWELAIHGFLAQQSAGDAAHDREHIRRVVASAEQLAGAEGAQRAIVLPAAWLHDCVSVPKSSPLRSQASRIAAQAAVDFLGAEGYPAEHLPAIAHAIEAHSFSAQIAPRTPEAMVLQDADRLDALGAIGIARCLMLSSSLGRRLYDPEEPIPTTRPVDDTANAIDHFYAKLLQLADTMQTSAGRREASRRTAFLRDYLAQLEREIRGDLG
jgi:uncharacterized protein